MCRIQENMSQNGENRFLAMAPPPPCDDMKSYCIASGRKRASSVRKAYNPAWDPAGFFYQPDPEGILYKPCKLLTQAKPINVTLPTKGESLPNATKKIYSTGPCVGSPPIQMAKKRMRAAVDAVSLLGARAGTPDAVALCRGDIKETNIWDYFKAIPAESAQRLQRPSSARRLLSARNKSVCVAGGRNRPSAVRRNLRQSSASDVDETDFDDGIRPSSAPDLADPDSADLELDCSWQIRIRSVSLADENLCLPQIVLKEHVAVSQPGAKPKFLTLKDLGETPRSRRPSMDSVSTAPTESDTKTSLSQTARYD
eukprot:gnl/MRDRNA2_/MRDRNA2_94359_c0_seq1.p1 gnl/MRDRNA2_/MRDRNA2_94359_c0~~gnl/MRDRNA2_/MRDRNA2_94359_c0_seq1.p1  ORF type:complete len:312 (-),score=54.53 gnl/MRDRNA2_/MRDRNA2_94359_c0_seq1:328-1263(-)